MDVELLLEQLAQVFPHHPRHALRNCINVHLLHLPEEADSGAVLDGCINWLLDQPAARAADRDVLPRPVLLDVIDLEEERDGGRCRVGDEVEVLGEER